MGGLGRSSSFHPWRSGGRRLGRFGAIAVVAILTACTPAYFDPDEERAGILIEWGTQQDRAGLEEVVGACEESLGFRFVHGAAIKFVDDANRHCAIPSHTPVAGCWRRARTESIRSGPKERRGTADGWWS